MISDELRFTFDVQGYLLFPGVMTSDEVSTYRGWVEEAIRVDLSEFKADHPESVRFQLNRPVSRIIDVDPRFNRFLDYPVVEPFLKEFLGPDYRHIDNDLLFSYPGYAGGGWHRGIRAHPTGHVVDGRFNCPMVKVFFCLTDVGPDQGAFVVVPGSHKARFEIDPTGRVDLPGQRVFDDIKAGDLLLFNEGLLHNGRPNPSDKTRITLIVNFGRKDAGVWEAYRPRPNTLKLATPRQREILSNGDHIWKEPILS